MGESTGSRTAETGTGNSVANRGRKFHTYVGAHLDEEEPDEDGLDHETRLRLEEQAIKSILGKEPNLNRTLKNNPGFDLFEEGPDGEQIRWVEVKAMTGCLQDRDVGISHTQFDCAREHGDAYWLYIVEHASDENNCRIVQIKDPAGKARTFTFDRGWIDVAIMDGD